MNPKLNSTISVVKISDNILEFFKTNTRVSIRIKVENDCIMNIVNDFDGTKSIDYLSKKHSVKTEELTNLISFLKQKGILENVTPKCDFDGYESFRRIIHFLAEYSNCHEHLLEKWNNIRNSNVLIIGLGAVGSWVACNLVQSGINNITIMDADCVEISNLHRQFGYNECDIGLKKVDALEKTLLKYNPQLNINKICKFLDKDILENLKLEKIDLIINCADKPNVDTTSLWIGEYATKRGIPHIVGGGYNLHLSLIGQTVIPHKTACVKCFQKHLEEENKIDPTRVKKLSIKNRKVGSFGPMCSIIASMVGMESIKVLTKHISPANINRRGEFNIYNMDITYKTYERRDDCEWCGTKGKYNN